MCTGLVVYLRSTGIVCWGKKGATEVGWLGEESGGSGFCLGLVQWLTGLLLLSGEVVNDDWFS